MSTARLSDQTKRKFSDLVRDLRSNLLTDLQGALDRRYSLGVKDRSRLVLSPEVRGDWDRLQAWLAQPGHNLGDLVKERAYTLLNRLVILRQMEARGLRKVKLISQGPEAGPFKNSAEFFTALIQGEDRGFGYLLDQVWDELALELPALFAYNPVHQTVPVPGASLVEILTRLSDPELEEAWTDDTTLGWLYQYWNDPDRKAVDEKLNTTTGKVEAGELSDKTQLFTERYMVEWLVQNSLGAQWLAICEKRGWEPAALGILQRLKEKREKSHTGARGHGGEEVEEFWKFYVEQSISPETVAAAPSRLEDVKVLDPAMGSGHFLVYVFDFLWELYREQGRLSGQALSPREILDRILGGNLHGIDIDNRAVQIGAAALFLKAREKVGDYRPRRLNLVASDLGLGNLDTQDPALTRFTATLEREVGLSPAESRRIIEGLKGADYLGSLLRVGEDIRRVLGANPLFGRTDRGESETRVLEALGRFIHDHDRGEDLGLASLADQLGKGLRLLALLDQKYDVVVANPPYLGLAKAEESVAQAIQQSSLVGKADLYSIFMEHSLNLMVPHGRIAMVTPRGWMFLSTFEELRKKLLKEISFIAFGDLDQGAFSDMKDVSATMFVMEKTKPENNNVVFVRPVPKTEIRRDQYQVGKNERGLETKARTYSFPQSRFGEISGSPMIYWWPEEFRQAYLKAPKLGKVGEVVHGLTTGNNNRFLREAFEIDPRRVSLRSDTESKSTKWFPYVKGAKGERWYEACQQVIDWEFNGLQVKQSDIHKFPYLKGNYSLHICNEQFYFRQGLAFSYIGTNGFLCRLRKYKSIFDVSGSSIFCDDPEKMQVLLSSNLSGYVSQSINPTINNQVGDIASLPVLDLIADPQFYLARAEALYDRLFASTETNLEYAYQFLSPEEFEVEEARIRHEIDREILAHFSQETVKAIYEEIGESAFNLPVARGHGGGEGKIPQEFEAAYLASESVLDLALKFRVHPDTVLAWKNELNLIHPGQRADRAFQHLSWALGVVLGRFDFASGGLRDSGKEFHTEARGHGGQDFALPHGLVYFTALDEMDSLERSIVVPHGIQLIRRLEEILKAKNPSDGEVIWNEIQEALVLGDKKKSLGEWIRLAAFDRHKTLYENRPIYFPLVSAKKNFFAWVNIHAWTDGTLTALLANYLRPDIQTLEARLKSLREAVARESDKKKINEMERDVATLDALKDELAAYAALVTQLAEQGPAPDFTEVQVPFVMDLDDGVMVNSAALRELVKPLWKDPSKWWEILSQPSGKKDFDWSHLAMGYWPTRVMGKVKKDPSLAVAHSDYGAYAGRDLFEELHPAAAKKWREQQAGKSGKAGGKVVRDGELEF